MSDIYIVNQTGHDISDAKRFLSENGKIKALTIGNVNIFATDRLTSIMQKKLKTFDPGSDYLLISGTPILNILATGIILSKYGIADLLIWDATKGKYTVRTIKQKILKGENHE